MHTLNQRFPYQETPTECNTHTHTLAETDRRPHKHTHTDALRHAPICCSYFSTRQIAANRVFKPNRVQ